jgi:hypothetical protein
MLNPLFCYNFTGEKLRRIQYFFEDTLEHLEIGAQGIAHSRLFTEKSYAIASAPGS